MSLVCDPFCIRDVTKIKTQILYIKKNKMKSRFLDFATNLTGFFLSTCCGVDEIRYPKLFPYHRKAAILPAETF